MKPHKGGRPTKADKLTLLDRRRRVAAAYLRGLSQWEIARQEDVDQAQVSRDLATLQKEWLASSLRDFDARKAEELAKIDALERTALEAWERSCRDAETLHAGTTKGRTGKKGEPLPDLTKTYKTVKGQSGDPRFLERVAWCIDQRCKILGLIVTKVAPTTPDGRQPYDAGASGAAALVAEARQFLAGRQAAAGGVPDAPAGLPGPGPAVVPAAGAADPGL